MPGTFTKLFSVLTTFASVTIANKKADVALEQVPYINYLFYFQKNTTNVRILINLGNKINAMTQIYTAKLDFKMYYTNV